MPHAQEQDQNDEDDPSEEESHAYASEDCDRRIAEVLRLGPQKGPCDVTPVKLAHWQEVQRSHQEAHPGRERRRVHQVVPLDRDQEQESLVYYGELYCNESPRANVGRREHGFAVREHETDYPEWNGHQEAGKRAGDSDLQKGLLVRQRVPYRYDCPEGPERRYRWNEERKGRGYPPPPGCQVVAEFVDCYDRQ